MNFAFVSPHPPETKQLHSPRQANQLRRAPTTNRFASTTYALRVQKSFAHAGDLFVPKCHRGNCLRLPPDKISVSPSPRVPQRAKPD
jgi:hypothetical protein